MNPQVEYGVGAPMTFNPLLAFWAMPYIMAQAWMTSWFSTAGRPDVEEAQPQSGQIPVPAPLQEDKESELFA